MGNSSNILNKIKSTCIIRTVFSFIRNNKKLNIIKYNNKLKKQLMINQDNYMNLIIFDLDLTEVQNINPLKKLKFINFTKDINFENAIKTGDIDIYCIKNNKTIYIDKNYLEETKVNKIKIIINNEYNLIKTFKRIFFNINILEEITIIYKNCKIQNFKQMFHFCTKLTSIKLYFDSIYPTNMIYMFGECISLKFISGIMNFITSKNTKFRGIFSGCESLEYLPDISDWDTSRAIDMSVMFSRCCSLKKLPDLSKWDTSNVKEIQAILFECKSLKELPDISEWNTKNITDMSYMFAYCRNLELLPDISRWNTENLKNAENMFFNCISLISLPDITKWNIQPDCSVEEFLDNCILLDIPEKIKNKFKINNYFLNE